ncbi:NAD-dependent epimerase [Kribbella antibiotica]|uniref:NAD-dependent epimerase n=1 Tax=Kribbella antibiotica TaxID=190195 RepID=A0A4R4ZTB5_9ACTN|nr:sugar nucleotide-binding protein [Kribbella antibiotica]TDD62065.1 NAD-dependent epimerase [Kribbella antibiotica]
MRLLILGGSWFLGRTLISDALARGWEVTAFSRGKSGQPPAGAAHVVGDRRKEGDLQRLTEAGPWDAVIDTSAYEPIDVARVTAALGNHVEQYVLVSTVSAYQNWPGLPVDESSPLWPSSPELTEDSPELANLTPTGHYGTLKSGCEDAATEGAKRSLIVRPGVILGPGEYVGRGLKLLKRAERGGRWLLPAPADQPIQPIDVRDVSTFLLDSIEAKRDGVFNLVAPAGYATYGDLIEICLELTGRRAEPVWVDPQWLDEHGVAQWTEMPLWRTPEGTWHVDGRRAAEAGLVCRPLADTLRDFKSALGQNGIVDHPRQAEHGMEADREAELLTAWDKAEWSEVR